MGLVKSLVLAYKSDFATIERATLIHEEIKLYLRDRLRVSPMELDEIVQKVTDDKIMSQRVLDAVGFCSTEDPAKVLDHNNIYDALLHELNKRL